MTRTDTPTLLGAYAVDAVDADEHDAVQDYLEHDGLAQAEVDSLRAAAAALAAVTETAPPERMRAATLAQVRTVRPLPPLPEPGGSDGGTVSRRRWLLGVAAGLGLGATALAWRPWQDHRREISTMEQVLQAEDAQSMTMTMSGMRATLTRSRVMNHAVFSSTSMPDPPAGRSYQLWWQEPAGTMRSAGVIPRHGGRPVQMMVPGGATATGAGVTMEPEGGSRTPTGAALTVATFA